jgi:hypothetical protein
MDLLAILIGIGAFIILVAMLALLWLSSRQEEQEDAVTQEIIIKANTGPIHVHDPVIVVTQEEED